MAVYDQLFDSNGSFLDSVEIQKNRVKSIVVRNERASERKNKKVA